MNEFSYSNLKDEWKRIDQALIPPDLFVSMPQPECKGLTLLTDVMINATVCKLGPRVGLITAPYSDDIEIVLDVAGMIERRMESASKPSGWIDRHLVTWVRSLETGAQTSVCIVATGGVVPAIDDCVSFVLWAEAGFPYPPTTLDDRISYVRDPEHYETEKTKRRLAREEAQLAELQRQDVVRGKSLAHHKALLELELECRRVRNLGWHELIAEHESAGPPTDDISSALYHLRISLLTLPAPGHPIGQH